MDVIRAGIAAAAAAAALLGAGCFPASTYECDRAEQCASGEVCARDHTCTLPSEVRSVRVRWTVAGVDAATECATRAIDDLTITFGGSDGSELSYAPVPCRFGSYFIDLLPHAYDQVELDGYDASGIYYYGVTIIAGDPEYTLTLDQAFLRYDDRVGYPRPTGTSRAWVSRASSTRSP
jgi:hypothetical protein